MEGGKKGRPCIVGLSPVSEAFVPTIQGVWRMQMSKDRSLAIGCLDFLFTREEEFNGVCFCFFFVDPVDAQITRYFLLWSFSVPVWCRVQF